jgi:hypothetical protein
MALGVIQLYNQVGCIGTINFPEHYYGVEEIIGYMSKRAN